MYVGRAIFSLLRDRELWERTEAFYNTDYIIQTCAINGANVRCRFCRGGRVCGASFLQLHCLIRHLRVLS